MKDRESEGSLTRPRKNYVRYLGSVAFLIAVLILLGYPIMRRQGEGAILTMVLACLISAIASLIGTVPLSGGRLRSVQSIVPAAMGSIALRLAVIPVLGFAVWVYMGDQIEIKLLLLWLAISHGVLLIADTMYARNVFQTFTTSTTSTTTKTS